MSLSKSQLFVLRLALLFLDRLLGGRHGVNRGHPAFLRPEKSTRSVYVLSILELEGGIVQFVSLTPLDESLIPDFMLARLGGELLCDVVSSLDLRLSLLLNRAHLAGSHSQLCGPEVLGGRAELRNEGFSIGLGEPAGRGGVDPERQGLGSCLG